MDLRVLEAGDDQAAAYAGKLFARWGAEVVRVDRGAAEAGADPRQRALELFLHGGKRRVGIDYGTAAGRDLLGRLAAQADIVLLDLPPAQLDALRWTELGARGRTAARVSVTPFGLSGPGRDWRATGATLLALGGYTFLTGDIGRTPLTIPGHYVEYQSGQFAFAAALAAVLDRQRRPSDRVATIEISMLEVVATLSQFTTVMWTHMRRIRSRHGNRWENLQPNAMYRCRDGWYQASGIGKFWEPFALMLGRPDLIEDPRFLTPELRTENADALEAIIHDRLGDRTMLDILMEAQETWRIPVGAALSLQGVLDDPHLAARGFWRELAAGDGAPAAVRTPGSPFLFVDEERPAEERPGAPEEAGAVAAGWEAREG